MSVAEVEKGFFGEPEFPIAPTRRGSYFRRTQQRTCL